MPDAGAGEVAVPAGVRRSVLLLSLATFSSMCVQRICDAMLPELAREFGVSLAQAAQVVSAFAIVYGVAQLVYGPLGDRFGKFRVVSFTTLGCAVGSIAAFFAASLDWLVLARVAVAACAAAVIPMALAWVGDAVDYAQRQAIIARLGLGTTLGVAAGQLAGGLITDWLGWRWAFALMALLFASVGSLLLSDLRRQQRTAPTAPASAGSTPLGFIAGLPMVLRNPWARVILVVAVVEGACAFGVQAIWAAHLHESLGLSLGSAGAIVALYGLGGMLYMATARRLIPRLGEHGLVFLGTGLLAACGLLIALTPWAWSTAPASLLAGFGFFMFHNTMQTNATQMAPRARGTGVSLFAAGLFLGQALGVTLAAWLVARLGSAATIASGALCMLLLGTVFGTLLMRHPAAERR